MDTVTVKAPEGATSASVAGVEYAIDEAGFAEVAGVHLPSLLVHGFVQAERPSGRKSKSEPKAE